LTASGAGPGSVGQGPGPAGIFPSAGHLVDCIAQLDVYPCRVREIFRSFRRSTVLLGLAAGMSIGFPGRAEPASEPGRLQELRQAYQAEVTGQASPVIQKYREELLKLERTCAGQRDYAGAATVRDERLRAEKKLSEWARRSPEQAVLRPYPGGPITLAAKEANTSGGVAYSKDQDALEGWKAKDASATWTLPFPLKAGGYEVVLEMACAPGSGGKITIKEDFHTLTRTITPTAGWNDFTSQTLGTLRVKANATSLTMAALTVEGDGLFLLRAVKLVPTSEASPQ